MMADMRISRRSKCASSQLRGDDLLEVMRRDAVGRLVLGLVRSGDIVTIALGLALAGMARGHHPALAIEEQTCQQARLLALQPARGTRSIGPELVLYCLEQVFRNYCFVLAWIDFTLVDDLAPINRVGKQVIERAALKDTAAAVGPAGSHLYLCLVALGIENIRELNHRTQLKVALVPEYFRSREESLLFYPTRISDHAGDPYVGMMTYYDIAFCRTGPSTRDRRFNLVAYANGVELSETTSRMADFNQNKCLFNQGYKPSNARHYSYYLRDGCRKLKSKPIRIYGEIADLIAYEDAILMNA